VAREIAGDVKTLGPARYLIKERARVA